MRSWLRRLVITLVIAGAMTAFEVPFAGASSIHVYDGHANSALAAVSIASTRTSEMPAAADAAASQAATDSVPANRSSAPPSAPAVGAETGAGVADAASQATAHGAERLAQAGFTEESIAATKAGQVFQQADGASVYLNETAPGRYDFIIEGDNGVVTAHTNWPLKSVVRLGNNYGWDWTP